MITFSCQTLPCTSTPFTLSMDQGVHLSHGGIPLNVEMTVGFNQSISTFYFQDANYSVSKKGFDTLKSNVVVFPQ